MSVPTVPAAPLAASSALELAEGAVDAAWLDYHGVLNERARGAGRAARVVFLGDSLTQSWELTGQAVWRHYYAARHPLNLGIGGDRTQHVLWRLRHGNIEGLDPRVVVLMIGTNNTAGDEYSVAQIAEGIAAIVALLQARLPAARVLLLGILPRSRQPDARRGKVLQVNQVVRQLADGERVRWLDFGWRFVARDGSIPVELMPDSLHLSPRGYVFWAEAIEDELSALLGDRRVAPLALPPPGGGGSPTA